MNVSITRLVSAVAVLIISTFALADVATPSILGDHMVLQRDQANPVWGWADPGEQVTVSIGDQQPSMTMACVADQHPPVMTVASSAGQ